MRPLLHSLRFRLIAFLTALLALWLILALVGSILNARQRIAAEVKASSALARALISAVSSNTKDAAATLREVEKHMPRTRHVQLGISHSRDPAVIMNEAVLQKQRRPAPSWFVNLVAAPPAIELVNTSSEDGQADAIFIIPNPSDEIAEVWQDFCFMAAFCSALVAFIVAVVLWMASHLLHPIRELGSGLERLAQSDFGVHLKPVRFSELERIRLQFNSLAQSLKDKTIENKTLYERLVSMQDKERRHVSRELHDELGPCLFGIRAETASIRQSLLQWPGTDIAAARTRSIDTLVDTIRRINRRILHTVQPAALSEKGVAAALRNLIDQWQETYPKITWSLDFSEKDIEGLSGEADLAIYRMVQEGLTNIARHAQCSEAEVRISRVISGGGEALEIRVTDNGQGFDPRSASGSGLQGMRERICKLGGEFNVDSGGGRGVAIRAVLRVAEIV
jgi:two-component system sensor histidine kinase UhpB